MLCWSWLERSEQNRKKMNIKKQKENVSLGRYIFERQSKTISARHPCDLWLPLNILILCPVILFLLGSDYRGHGQQERPNHAHKNYHTSEMSPFHLRHTSLSNHLSGRKRTRFP